MEQSKVTTSASAKVMMTEQEKFTFDEYGTAYPCCGNCEHIREAGFGLMCDKYLEYRDYNYLKCTSYKYKQNIQVLKELKGE